MTLGARLAQDPRLVLWIELLAVAHITGERPPDPDLAWLESLTRDHDDRTLACAVGQCIQASVDTRYPALIAVYQPEELISHLLDHVNQRLNGQQAACGPTETRWQAGQFRWIDVRRTLRAHLSSTEPHPDTARWKTRGLDLPGNTCKEQLQSLLRRQDSAVPQPVALRGSDPRPRYEVATEQLDAHADPYERLAPASRYLNIQGQWPQMHLYRAEWSKRRQAK